MKIRGKSFSILTFLAFGLPVIALLALPFPAALAADSNYTWNGSGSDGNWSTSANWSSLPPSDSSGAYILHFAGSTRTSSTNNFAAYTQFEQILFDSGASSFTLGGAAVKLYNWNGVGSGTAKIENNSGNLQTVSFNSSGVGIDFVGTGELDPTQGNLTINNNVIMDAGSGAYAGNEVRVFGNNGHVLTLNGALANGTGGATLNFVNENNNTVILAGSSTYTGYTTEYGGEMRIVQGGSINSSSQIYLGGTNISSIATTTAQLTLAGTGQTLTPGITTQSGTLTFASTNTSGTNTASGNITLGTGLTTSVSSGGTLLLSGSLSGSGALTKVGAGTLTLSNVNTYTGTTTVSGGTLQLDFTGLPTPTYVISSSSALSVGAGTLSILGKATGTTSQTLNGVNATGAGNLNFNSNGGTLNATLGSVTRTFPGTLNITLPSTGTVTATVPNLNNGVIVDATYNWADFITIGGTTWATSSAQSNGTLGAFNSYTTSFSGAYYQTHVDVTSSQTLGSAFAVGDLRFATNNVTLTLGAANNNVDAAGILVTPGVSGTIAATGGGSLYGNGGAQRLTFFDYGNLTVSAPITDTGSGVVFTGTGTTTLSGTNTYSGATTVSSGTLIIGGAGQLGSGNYSAAISVSSAFVYNSSASQTLSGIISGAGSVTQNGTGTLTLSGASTYSGGTYINSGTLTMGASSTISGGVLNNGPLGTGAVNLAGGTLSLGLGANNVIGNNIVAAASTTSIINSTAGGVAGIGENGNPSALVTTFSGSGNITLSITDGLRLRNTDWSGFSGTLTLASGNNVFIAANTNFSHIIDLSHATLNLTTGGFQVQYYSNQTLRIGALSGSGGTVTGNQAGTSYEIGNLNTNTSFAGVIANASGATPLTKVGTGTLTLSGANTYTGGTNLNGGMINLGIAQNGGTSGPLGASGTIAFGGGGLQYSSVNQTDYSSRFSTATNQAYTVDTNGQTVTWATGLTSSGGSLTKAGAGTLTLTGTNTYTGTTSITNGTLKLAPSSGVAGTGIAGLWEGLVSNTSPTDTTDAIPLTSIQSVARWGASNNSGGTNIYPAWGTNTTWGYKTYLDNTSSGNVTYTFGKNFDDNAYLVIDGTSVISNTTWNQNATGSISLAPGLHTVDLRFGQGSGGVGPDTGAYNNFGISYNTVGNSATNGTWLQMGGTDSNTVFYASGGAVVLSANTTLDLSAAGAGQAVIGSLADASGSPTGQTVLLGSTTLYTGLDNTNTTFSGVISGSGGSLAKFGSGTFTLSGSNSFSGATTISSGTLQISGAGSLGSGTYAGNISNAGTLQYSSSASQTLSGNISGVGALTKDTSSTGTLTLSGSNTYTGATTVSAGTLNVAGSGVINSGATNGIVVGNVASTNATLNTSGTVTASNLTVSNNSNAVGAVFQTGGTVSFGQAAGTTNFALGAATGAYGYYSLSGGTVAMNEAGLGGAAANNTVGVMDVSGGTVNDGGWLAIGRGQGSSGVLNVTGGTVNIATTSGPAGHFSLNTQNFSSSSSGTVVVNLANGSISGPATSSYGYLDLMETGNASNLSVFNLLTGGTLTINKVQANSATGKSFLNFNGGVLKATTTNSGGSFLTSGNITGIYVYSGGGTVDNNGTSITISNPLLAVSGSGVTTPTITSAGSGYVGAPMVTISGGGGTGATGYASISSGTISSIVITNPGTGYTSAPMFTLTGGGAASAGTITGVTPAANATTGGLTFQGAGTTILSSGASTYSGGTKLNAGQITLGASSTGAGNSVTSGPLGTGTLTMNGGTIQLNAQTLGNNIVVTTGSSATIDNAVNNGTLSGDVSGGGTLTIQNTSSILLSDFAYGSWSGFTGTLNYNTATKIVNFFAPASMDLSNAAVNFANSGNVTNSSFRTSGTTKLGSLTGFGYLDVSGTVEIGNLNTSGTFSGIVRDNGSPVGTIRKIGSGTLTLTGASTNTGGTQINGGTLTLGNASALSTSAGGISFGGGTLQYGSGITTDYSSRIAAGTSGSAVAIDTGTNSVTFATALTGSQSGGLTKSGSGTLTLSANNAYTGATTVNNGTLKVTGTIGSTNGVTVNSGATLTGNGLVSGTTTVAVGGILTNGNSNTAALTLGGLTFSGAGGTVNIYTSGTSAVVVVNNALTTTGSGVTINVTTAPVWANGTTYNLISYGSLSGVFSNFVKGSITALGARQSATLGNSGSAITLAIAGDTPFWTGAASNAWTTNTVGTPFNWQLQTAGTGTEFLTNDQVLFDDNATGTTNVDITTANVTVASVSFNNNTKTYVISGTNGFGIAGSGATLTKSGTGTAILTSSNSYTGATTINAGTLQIGNGGTTGSLSGSSAITNNGALVFNRSNAVTQGTDFSSAAISGTGTLTQAGSSTLTLNAVNTYTGATIISSGTLSIGGAGQLGSGSYAGNITDNGVLSYDSSAAQTFSGSICGTGVLNKATSSSTLTLSGSSSYSGGTTLSAGTVTAGNNNAFGSGTIILNGGALNNNGGDKTVANNIAIGSNGGSISIGSGAGNLTLTGTLSGAGNINIPTSTLNSLNWNFAANTMTSGTITVANGGNNTQVFRLNVPAATSSSLDWVMGGASDRWNLMGQAGTYNFGSLAGSGNLADNFLGSNQAVIVSIGGNNHDATFSGQIRTQGGTVSVIKTGNGTETFSGANNYNGGTTVSAGTLKMANASALGSTSGDLAVNGGTVDINGYNLTFGMLSGSSGAVITSSTTGTLTLTGSSSSNSTYAGAIQNGSATVSLVKANSGTLTLSGSNTYSGGTIITSGTLQMANANALGSSAGNLAVNGGTLDLNGNNLTFGTLSGSSGAVITSSTTGTLTLTGSSSSNSTYAGVIQNGSATVSLVKANSGTLTLSGASTYSGGTYINSGTLTMGASSTITSGTLTNGPLGTGAVNLAGGTLSLGANNVIGNNVVAVAGTTSIISQTSGGAVAGIGENGGPSSLVTTFSGSGNITLSITDGLRLRNTDWSGFSGTLTLASGNNAFIAANTNFSHIIDLSQATLNLTTGAFNVQYYTGQTLRIGALSGSGGTITGNQTGTSYEIGNLNTNTSFAGVIADASGATPLTKTGTGTLTLSGANTYTGATSVNAGTLSFSTVAAGTGAQGLGGGTTVNLGASSTSSGVLKYTGAAGTLDKNINALGNGSDTVQNSGTGLLTLSGTLTKNGTKLTLNGGSSGINVTGKITGASAGSDLIITGGTTTLSNANNDYNGPTYVYSGGTLKDGTANAIPVGSSLTLGESGSNTTGTYDLNGYDQTLAGLNTAGSGGSGNIVTNSASGSGTNTLTDTGGGSFSGRIADGSTAHTALTVSGGTLTLSGSNSYTGGTTLTSGTLVAGNDYALGSGLMTLNGGSLQSNNAARSLLNPITVTASGGTVSGNTDLAFMGTADGSGTLTVNMNSSKKLTVNPTSANSFAPDTIMVSSGTLLLGGANKIGDSTKISLNGGTFNTGGYSETVGALTLSGSSTLDLGSGASTFTFASQTGALSGGTLSVLNWTSGSDHLVFHRDMTDSLGQVSFSGFGGTGQISLSGGNYELVPIPEPATIIGALAVVGLIVVRERRRLTFSRSK